MRRTLIHPAKLAAVGGLATLLGLAGASSAAATPGRGNPSVHNAATVRSAVTAESPACSTGNDARGAANAYLDALVSHDASAVPFATDVLRVENGLVTGRSADEIRKDLNTSVKYKIITGLRDKQYTDGRPSADGTVTVNVAYRLDVGAHNTTLLTVQVRERFDVRCGQITYINATIGLW
jgi:hypothetical protein